MSALAITNMDFAALRVYAVYGVLGDSSTMTNTEEIPERDIRTRILVVDGTATYTTVEGGTNLGVTERSTGDNTLDQPPYNTYKIGVVKIEVVSPTFKYYCMSRYDNKRLTGNVVKMVVDDTTVAQQGKLVFVAKGSIQKEDHTFTAPTLLNIQSGDMTFTAKEDVLLAVLDT